MLQNKGVRIQVTAIWYPRGHHGSHMGTGAGQCERPDIVLHGETEADVQHGYQREGHTASEPQYPVQRMGDHGEAGTIQGTIVQLKVCAK